MTEKVNKSPDNGKLKRGSIFHIKFAWLAALAASISAWFGLS
jgi:hypothetical protein